MLEQYVRAFEARDAGAVAEMMNRHGLVEIPMLKPNRLVGGMEIERGHVAAFETIVEARFRLGEAAENGEQAIATGALSVKRVGGEERTTPVGIVAEMADGGLQRVSLYLDARNQRLWSDKAIL